MSHRRPFRPLYPHRLEILRAHRRPPRAPAPSILGRPAPPTPARGPPQTNPGPGHPARRILAQTARVPSDSGRLDFPALPFIAGIFLFAIVPAIEKESAACALRRAALVGFFIYPAGISPIWPCSKPFPQV